MFTTPAHDPLMEAQLLDAVTQLRDRAVWVFGRLPESSPTSTHTTSWYVRSLREQEAAADAETTALEILAHVLDPEVPREASFWASALGRALAWHAGYIGGLAMSVPQPVVAAALGISKQAAAKRIHYYTLKFPGRRYNGAALRDALRTRWADIERKREADEG
jgi:hypothetical protein